MECNLNAYWEILDVKESYNTRKEEKTAILSAYRDWGALIYPDWSDDKNAEAAFKSK